MKQSLNWGVCQMWQWFSWFIFFWVFILAGLFAIGGYFMFRKFLKLLPLADGKSKIDWQNYYVDKSRHLWTDDSRTFLNLLVDPVPAAFRDVAKHSIGARIGQVGLEKGVKEITRAECLEGYILATPKRDHRSLKSYLDKLEIDYSAYNHLLK